VRTVASWRASVAALADLTGTGADDVVWLPGPLASSLYLHGAWHAAQLGALPVCAPRPPAGATVLHAVPSALDRALDAAEAGALPRLRTAVVAGDALPDPMRRRAAALGWRLVEYYGAAELSFVGWRTDAGPFRAFPGVEVRTAPSLLVRSPYVARGYLDAADDGPLVRVADPPGPPWLGVGDLAEPADAGFVLLGRGDAAVTTGGATVVAEEVEAVLRTVPGVRDAVVVGTPHARLGQLVVAVVDLVDDAQGAAVRAALRSAVAELPAPARPRRWHRSAGGLRTPAGKPDRAGALRAVADGTATLLA
jgi:acyl-CoA synthetase (AMP-forming)/AMP-acid ligase II